MDNTTLVYASPEPFYRHSFSTSPDGQSSVPSPQQCSSSSQQTVAMNGLQSIRKSFQQRAISSKATNIILQSWSTGTQKQYAPYIKRWHDFCSKWKVNPYNPPLNKVLDTGACMNKDYLTLPQKQQEVHCQLLFFPLTMSTLGATQLSRAS